jgi:hypothetical protein
MTAPVQQEAISPLACERPQVKEHPRRSESLTLAALPSAVNSARSFVVSTLERWRAPLVIGDTVHLAEEMVTDAVKTTGVSDPTVRWRALTQLELLSVTLVGLRSSIGIEVWDAEPYPPYQLNADHFVMRVASELVGDTYATANHQAADRPPAGQGQRYEGVRLPAVVGTGILERRDGARLRGVCFRDSPGW